MPSRSDPKELAIEADFWFNYDGEHRHFPVSTEMAYKVGNDTRKKLMTDATTKALSFLGFNADVFMGRFDDSKYVEALKAEKRSEPKDSAPAKVDGSSTPAKEMQSIFIAPSMRAELVNASALRAEELKMDDRGAPGKAVLKSLGIENTSKITIDGFDNVKAAIEKWEQ